MMLVPGLGLVPLASAQTGTVWRCVDAGGRAQYTNVQADTAGRTCTVVTREVTVVAPQPGTRTPAAAAVPPGSTGSRDGNARGREDTRRSVLESELQSEQQALAKAREALAEQEGLRSGNERNYQRVLDRLAPFQEAVEQHSRNIDALQRELGRLK
jgi:hypothetical protein